MKFSITKQKNPNLTIGIENLPESVSAIYPGRLYGLCVRNGNIRETLVAGTIEGAWQEGAQVVVVSSTIARWAGLIEKMAERIPKPLQANKPLLLEKVGDYQTLITQYGLDKLLQELEDSGIPEGSLLIIDEAETLFTLSDLKLVKRQGLILRGWVREWKHCGVFVFHKLHFESPNAGNLRAQCNCLDGLAELNADLLRLSWNVDHWVTPDTRIETRSYGVSHNEEHPSLSADGSSMDTLAHQLLYAPDEDQVLTTEDAVIHEKNVPSNWKHYENFSELLQAVQHAVAATVILHYNSAVKFETLAETTHKIRETAGRGLKIIIWEKDKRLRYNQTMALMQLGANQVVLKFERFSQLLWSIESLKGHCFEKKPAFAYDGIINEASPFALYGYLRPQRFCDFVQTTLDRTHDISIQHALVCLDLLPGRSHIDALLTFNPKRKGDVLTADNKSLLVFFFACREPDIDIALRRSLNISIDELFLQETRWTNRDDIGACIQKLRKLSIQNELVDYTSQLHSHTNIPLTI